MSEEADTARGSRVVSGRRAGTSTEGSASTMGRSRYPTVSVLPPPPPVPLGASAFARDHFNNGGGSSGGGGGWPFNNPSGGGGGGGTTTSSSQSSGWPFNQLGNSGGGGGGGTGGYSLKPTPPPAPPDIPTREARCSILDFRVDSDTLTRNQCILGLPGRTGTGIPVLGHHPRLVLKPPVPHRSEPLYSTNQELALEMMSHDAERMARPLEVKNRVVFDSLDAPPQNAHHSGASEASAAAAMVGPPVPYMQTGSSTSSSNSAQGDTFKDGTLPPPFYHVESHLDDTLVFESRFESGNLRRAIQVYDFEYDLILRPDINTRGHTQWFYFSVSNTCRNVPYKLNIINMVKSDSLYQYGMQPLICSEKDSITHGRIWKRNGINTSYYQNNIKRKNGHYYYTFTCTYQFPHDHDTVYIAYCYPYTYTDLQRYLRVLEESPKRRQRFRRRVLCQTLAGNHCDLLTVTSFGGNPESLRHRRGVVITGRVHPGESNASWMMKGTLDFLTGPSLDAKLLRDNFVFKIVPMLNPDGVINGNYRCSLAGVDLNRVWNDPNKKLHPTIYHTKMMIKRLMEDREVVMFCDYHGHSRKKNVFMYGCERKPDRKGFTAPPADRMMGSSVSGTRLLERVFPFTLQHAAPDIFSFSDCNFKVQKSKENTARVVLWREFNLINSFTLEASFAGPTMGSEAGLHYSVDRLQQMGALFCEAILDYCDPDTTRMQAVLRELEIMYPPKQLGSGLLYHSSSFNVASNSSVLSEPAPQVQSSTLLTRNSSSSSLINGSEESEEEDLDSDSDDDSDFASKNRRKKGSKNKKDSKSKKSSGSGGGGGGGGSNQRSGGGGSATDMGSSKSLKSGPGGRDPSSGAGSGNKEGRTTSTAKERIESGRDNRRTSQGPGGTLKERVSSASLRGAASRDTGGEAGSKLPRTSSRSKWPSANIMYRNTTSRGDDETAAPEDFGDDNGQSGYGLNGSSTGLPPRPPRGGRNF